MGFSTAKAPGVVVADPLELVPERTARPDEEDTLPSKVAFSFAVVFV